VWRDSWLVGLRVLTLDASREPLAQSDLGRKPALISLVLGMTFSLGRRPRTN
jgi:hypothetical protein